MRTRGPQKAPTKVSTTIRLSSDVVQAFRATGDGWQTRVDAALKDFENLDEDMDDDDDQIESCVRALPNASSENALKLAAQKRLKANMLLKNPAKFMQGSFTEALMLVENHQCNDAIIMALETLKFWLNLKIY